MRFSAELSRGSILVTNASNILCCCVPGNKEDEFLNNNFKRFAAVISLSLVATIVTIPCAAFFVSAQTANDDAVNSKSETAETMALTESTYKAEEILADKESTATVSRAQAFDVAKKTTEETMATIEEEASSAKATVATSSKYLLDIANPDASYLSYSVKLTEYDRDVLEHLVMGEAGGEGFIGCCLVAQAIRDTLVTDGYSSVEAVRTGMGYYGSLYNTPNQDAIDAVKFIFDEGGAAVQHTLIYFYAPTLCTSGFHESQEFVVEHNSHRFFDRW